MSPEVGRDAAPLTTGSFTKAGHAFAGWNTAAIGSGIPHVDGAGAISTTAVTFPSVTSGASADQLYQGYGHVTQTGVAGTTAGFAHSLTAPAESP